jgi:hypothetical protein
MRPVTKMGLAINIYPIKEELFAIKAIKETCVALISQNLEYSWDIKPIAEPVFEKNWPKIKYYRQSKYLSKGIKIFRDNNRWDNLKELYENVLSRIWKPSFDMPSRILEQVEYTKQISEQRPTMMGFLSTNEDWVYKGIHYATSGPYTNEELSLLILEEFDKERQLFEKLKQKHISGLEDVNFKRQRIPENVRIEVWRRDGGKCARCGSREKLEYDHIVPVSRGGSNTARNIELLCEKCNRTKSNNIA